MAVKALLEDLFKEAFLAGGLKEMPVILEGAKNPQFGDYQVNGAMSAAKKLKCNPQELAKNIIRHLPENNLIDTAGVAGPGFINLKLTDAFLGQNLATIYPQGQLQLPELLKGQTVIIDYSSPNLAKEMHVGHLRSTLIGDSLHRLYEGLGAKVIAQNHVGDWGTQFGMLIAYLDEIEEKNTLLLKDLEHFYRQAKKRFDEDPSFAEKARQFVVRLHEGNKAVLSKWQEFVFLSVEHIDKLYRRLNVRLQKKDIKGESSYRHQLASIVANLLAKKIAVQENGTVLVYLNTVLPDKNIQDEVWIIQKKGGGFLYATTDLAALKENVESLAPTRLLYVVDSRQSLHFKALFAVSSAAGWLSEKIKAEHVAFGTMMDEEGRPFKTREGGTVKLVDLLEEAVIRAKTVLQEKNSHLSEEELTYFAEIVGIAAVKYADLSRNRLSDYIFNLDAMLSLEGNTAPYLLYAYVRIQSLLRKAAKERTGVKGKIVITGEERSLALLLNQFEEILLQVVKDNKPHYLANYLYALSTEFSRFYEHSTVLNAIEEKRDSRLALAALTGEILKKGLNFLGIDVLQRM